MLAGLQDSLDELSLAVGAQPCNTGVFGDGSQFLDGLLGKVLMEASYLEIEGIRSGLSRG